jgi:hypothetical protein
MILSIPFFPGLTDYDKFAEVLKKNGQCDGHVLFVVSLRSDEEAALAFRKKVEPLFARSFGKVLNPIEEGGMTGLANAMFKASARFFEGLKDQPGEPAGVPLLYMDPTWQPHKTGWMDSIQAEYFTKGMPQALCRFKTNSIGEKISQGPVLLARSYFAQTALLPHLPPRQHWRLYLRNEIGRSLIESETIGTGDKSVVRLVKPVKAAKPTAKK